MKIKNKSGQYVKNADLVREIIDFKTTGIASETLGHYLMLIAAGILSKGNFCSYTYKSDMASEAVLTCIKYLRSFDPARGNAFAYVTQICKHSAVAFIKKEHRHADVKSKCYDNYENMVLAQMEDVDTKAICYQDYGEKRKRNKKKVVDIKVEVCYNEEEFVLGEKI